MDPRLRGHVPAGSVGHGVFDEDLGIHVGYFPRSTLIDTNQLLVGRYLPDPNPPLLVNLPFIHS